jgi:hypothetical protein
MHGFNSGVLVATYLVTGRPLGALDRRHWIVTEVPSTVTLVTLGIPGRVALVIAAAPNRGEEIVTPRVTSAILEIRFADITRK